MSNEAQQNGESPDKVAKNYEATMKKVFAIVGGEKNLNPKKRVTKDTMKDIVANLLKGQREETAKEVTDGLKALLSSHVELKKLISEKKAELEKLEKTKMKEFTDQANKLFGKVEDMDKLEAEYIQSLGEATSGTN